MVLADLPGIIEGAHANKGLGHEFLQHVERTKALLYVIDGSSSDGRNPLKDFQVLYDELRLYKEGLLLEKPAVVAVNKCDRQYTKFGPRYDKMKLNIEFPMIPISAKEGTNLELLIETMKEVCIDQ